MQRRKVLVVDDDEGVRSVTVEMLSVLGFDVSTADDGARAIEQTSRHVFDLVLLDLVIPAMSGIEVFQSIRRTSETTRVLFMTGYSKADIGDLLRDKATAALEKPFSMDALQSSVQALLEEPLR